MKRTTFWLILRRSTERLMKTNLLYQASALSYITIVSIVPIVSVIFYFVSLFPLFSDLVILTQSYIYNNFLPTSSIVVTKYLAQFILQASQLPIISIIFSFVSAIFMLMTVESAFNEVWEVTDHHRSLLSRLEALLVLITMPFFIGLSSFLLQYLLTFTNINVFQSFQIFIIHYTINIVVFAIIYVFVPNIKVSWRNGFWGGFIATSLFEVTKQLFKYYISVSNYQILYGAVAFLPIFFLWVYISWVIIIFAALFVQTKMKIKAEHLQAQKVADIV